MQANVESVGVMVQDMPAVWDRIRSWAERLFTKEHMVDGALVIVTVALLGVLQFALYRAVENWTCTGFAVPVFGFF